MEPKTDLLLAADAILLLHAALVLFVALALPLIIAGAIMSWAWVRNPWFRYAHLLAIGVVVAQAWLGQICPLTVWEMRLRALGGGDGSYDGSFIAHWVSTLLYYDAAAWVFAVLYTLFGLAVAGAWFRVRPRPFS